MKLLGHDFSLKEIAEHLEKTPALREAVAARVAQQHAARVAAEKRKADALAVRDRAAPAAGKRRADAKAALERHDAQRPALLDALRLAEQAETVIGSACEHAVAVEDRFLREADQPLIDQAIAEVGAEMEATRKNWWELYRREGRELDHRGRWLPPFRTNEPALRARLDGFRSAVVALDGLRVRALTPERLEQEIRSIRAAIPNDLDSLVEVGADGR